MSNADEELWRAFSEEVGEQLDNLELELSKGTAACDIHQVFRDFHTIKSSCAMLDMGSMKELAHVSEDYLDLLRKDALKLTEQAIDTLLSAVEKLKQQLAQASVNHQNPAAATDIIGAINTFIKRQNVSSSTMSLRPAAALASDINNGHMSDRQAELAPLAKLSRSALPDLAQARQLTPALKNSLITFGNMAQLLDLPLLQIVCRDIVLAFHHAGEDTARITGLQHQADLIARIRDLEKECSLDFGSTLAAKTYRVTFEKTFLHLILDLVDVFAALEQEDVSVWLQSRHEPVDKQLGRLSLLASLFGLPDLRNLFTYLTQVIRSARRGYFQPGADFAAVLRQSIAHPYTDLLLGDEYAQRDVVCAALVEAQKRLKRATQGVDVDTLAATVAVHTDETSFFVNETSASRPLPQTTFDMPQQLLGSTLRINSQVVDELVTQVGEVVMARNMIGNIVNRDKYDLVLRKCRHILELEKNKMASQQQMEELKSGLMVLLAMREELVLIDTRLHSAITQVQQKVLDLRELPVAMIFNRLPNIVRKIAHASGKNIQLQMSGENACVDKGMMDILLKTLAALLQYMIVDGADVSELSVTAATRGNYLNLVLACNSSLAESATRSELKTLLEGIGGQLRVDNQQQDRSVISLDFPRSVAMQSVLLVRSGTSVSAISERNIIEIRQFKGLAVNHLQGRAAIAWRNEIIPLVHLDEWTHSAEHRLAAFQRQDGNLLIVNSGNHHVGIVVDAIVGLRDSFVPETHVALSALTHINGSTVLGDGSVVFVLNSEQLLQSLQLKLPALFRSRANHQSSQHLLFQHNSAQAQVA